MTTELILLIAVWAFIVLGVFMNPDIGPIGTFNQSGPRLGARIERNVAVGYRYTVPNGTYLQWEEAQ